MLCAAHASGPPLMARATLPGPTGTGREKGREGDARKCGEEGGRSWDLITEGAGGSKGCQLYEWCDISSGVVTLVTPVMK